MADNHQAPYQFVAKQLIAFINNEQNADQTQAQLGDYYRRAIVTLAKNLLDGKMPVAEFLEKFLEANAGAELLTQEAYSILKKDLAEAHETINQLHSTNQTPTSPTKGTGTGIGM